MNQEAREQLGEVIRIARARHDLTAREVGRRAGVDFGTVRLLERGMIGMPRIESVRAIAQVLEVPLADVYSILDWLPADELPTLRPYMRAKYAEMSDDELADVEQFIDGITKRHGHGPRAHEDE